MATNLFHGNSFIVKAGHRKGEVPMSAAVNTNPPACCHRFASLLRRFFPILAPLAVPNTFYTHNLSKYGLFPSLSQYGLFQNPALHTCFGLNLKP
jgi:hypothetical protein